LADTIRDIHTSLRADPDGIAGGEHDPDHITANWHHLDRGIAQAYLQARSCIVSQVGFRFLNLHRHHIEYPHWVGFGEPRTQWVEEPTNCRDPFFPPRAPLLVVPLLGLFLKEFLKGHRPHSPSRLRSFANQEPWLLGAMLSWPFRSCAWV